MKFSVITVVLNPDQDFAYTAESILAQTHPDVEWIVFDGLSLRGHDVLNRYSGFIDRLICEEDDGVYSAMNKAAKHASGDYIVFMNAGDTFYLSSTLSELNELARGGADIFYGDHVYADGNVAEIHRACSINTLRGIIRDGDLGGRWHSRFPCHQATFYRRSLFESMSFDEQLRICADHDFLLRASKSDRVIEYVNCLVCRYSAGGYSARMYSRLQAEWFAVYSQYSDNPGKLMSHFLGEIASSFSFQEDLLICDGTYGFEGPYPEFSIPRMTWIKPEGLTLVALRRFESAQLTLAGNSRFQQNMLVTINDRVVFSELLSAGPFQLAIDLSCPLVTGDVVRAKSSVSGQLAERDVRVSGWSLWTATIKSEGMLNRSGHSEDVLSLVRQSVSQYGQKAEILSQKSDLLPAEGIERSNRPTPLPANGDLNAKRVLPGYSDDMSPLLVPDALGRD